MGSSHWPSTYTSCTTAAQVYSYRCPLNHCDYDYPLDQILLSVPNMHVSLSFQAKETYRNMGSEPLLFLLSQLHHINQSYPWVQTYICKQPLKKKI